MSKTLTWQDQSDGGQALRNETTTYGGTGYSYGTGTFTKTNPDQGIETTYLGGCSNPVSLKVIEPNGDSTDLITYMD